MADKIRKDEGAEQEQVEKIDLGASLRKEHKDKKPVSRIAILIVLAVLIALGAVLVGQVIRQATDLMERLPELLSALPVLADRITARLRSFCAGCPEGLQQWVTQLLERLGARYPRLFHDAENACMLVREFSFL